MQSAAIRLQSRQRAPSVLAVCERLFNCTVSTSAGTSSGRVGQSLFDQQPVSGFIEKAFKYCPAPHQTSAKDCFAIPRKAFTSSAEFSGGRFKVSSPASKQDDRHNGASEDDIDDRVILLEASLKFVNDKGWSDAALIAGAKHIGLSPAIIGILPRGPAELVEHFEQKCNEELASQLQSKKKAWQGFRMPQRVKEGLKLRLQMNAPYIDIWAQAISIRSQPRNVPVAIEQLAQVIDDVWHAAGDKSTDYNWFTKRGLLAGVYTATELYMLTDYSPEFADTWDVLDRRLHDVMTIGKVMGQMGTSAASLMEQISVTLSQMLPQNHGQHTRG